MSKYAEIHRDGLDSDDVLGALLEAGSINQASATEAEASKENSGESLVALIEDKSTNKATVIGVSRTN